MIKAKQYIIPTKKEMKIKLQLSKTTSTDIYNLTVLSLFVFFTVAFKII